MDHMKSDNFGELLAALSGSGNSNGASSNDSHVVHVSGNNASGLKKMHSQPQQLPQQQPDFQHQPQPQYVWQAVPPQAAAPAQHAQQAQHMMQMPQLNYGYPISQQMQMPQPMPQPMPQQFFPTPHQNQTQINQAPATATIPIPIDSLAELKGKALSSKKSFPIVLLTVSLIILGFAVLAVWYYSKKNVLANAVPLLKDSLRNEENEENENEKSRLPPPKLFLVSEQEDDATKLMQDSHVIENLERYLSSPPSFTSTPAPSNNPASLTPTNPTPKPIPKHTPTFTSNQNQSADEKKRDLKSMPQRSQRPQPQRHSNNSNTNTRFTKLSDVLAEEDEDEKVQDEVEVEVNGFKKKMPKRIDSDSPEISEFMKRREQAEKENLKWIESQREKPRVTEDDEEENEDT